MNAKNLGNRNAEMWEYEEWDVKDSTWSGNPFDVEATVTFKHQKTGEIRKTGMFYDNNNTWSFRFTGDQLGKWTYTTSSKDADLNGLSGTVEVKPNDDKDAYGFVTQAPGDGSKWARQQGNEGKVEAFVPQLLMSGDISRYDNNLGQIDKDIQTFIDGHGFTGFHVTELAGRWFDFDLKSARNQVNSNMKNPDTETFEVLEDLISKTNDAGGIVHLWAWGDADRGLTPGDKNKALLSGGINGEVDKRLQRYIAARLGPVAGWSLGYGFDLNEWVTESQIQKWHDNLQSQLGWEHSIGGRSSGPNSGTNHSKAKSFNEGLSYSGYEHHRPDYDVYSAALDALPGQPVLSEDRFRIRNGGRFASKDYTPESTRRGLWQSTMAGGVGNIWGNYVQDWDPTKISETYSNKNQIKTYSRFFFGEDRFLAGMTQANNLTDGYALKTSDNQNYVFYKENTASIQLDLSKLDGPQRAVAVNTENAYKEIDLGVLAAKNQTIKLSGTSDWAISVGKFESGPVSGPAPTPPTPTPPAPTPPAPTPPSNPPTAPVDPVTPPIPMADKLVSNLTLDDGAGKIAKDSSTSGLNNKGILTGGAKFINTGADKGTVAFDGTGDAIKLKNSRDINKGIHRKRTISLWFRADDPFSERDKETVYEEGGKTRGANIYLDGDRLYVGGWNTPDSESGWKGTWLSTKLNKSSANERQHVALVLDGGNSLADGAFHGYLNGQKFGTGEGSQLWEHTGGIGIGNTNRSTLFHDGAKSSTGLTGVVDQVQIFNEALNNNQIGALADA
ncbi:MAG: DUF5060 domain-containing protein [Cyanobacteria bacterium J06635_1]